MGTKTSFSFYFPPKEEYQGRFFQYFTPVPDNENLSQDATREEEKIGFSIAGRGERTDFKVGVPVIFALCNRMKVIFY